MQGTDLLFSERWKVGMEARVEGFVARIFNNVRRVLAQTTACLPKGTPGNSMGTLRGTYFLESWTAQRHKDLNLSP